MSEPNGNAFENPADDTLISSLIGQPLRSVLIEGDKEPPIVTLEFNTVCLRLTLRDPESVELLLRAKLPSKRPSPFGRRTS